MTITATKMQQIRVDTEAALLSVAMKHGLRSLSLAKGKYGDDNFEFKLEGVVLGGMSVESKRYESFRHNLALPMLGSTFDHKGVQYSTIGLNTTGSKVLCKQTVTGKTYLFDTVYVKHYAGRAA